MIKKEQGPRRSRVKGLSLRHLLAFIPQSLGPYLKGTELKMMLLESSSCSSQDPESYRPGGRQGLLGP